MMNPEGCEKTTVPPVNVAGNPPPPYGMTPPMYGQPAAVTVVQPMATAFGPEVVRMVCPSCHATITTKTCRVTSTKTHLIALVMCLVGLWPCCLIPYCVDNCKNTNHLCPSCNSYLGQYKA